jgi:predicted nucleic acid-binding protein
MSDRVIDASAIAALAFAEDAALQVIEQIDGCSLHAPALVTFEIANVAWKLIRRTPTAKPRFMKALEFVDEMHLHYRGIDQRGVVELGLETGLSAYDASYLWLSRYLGAPLVTLDRKLAAHAKDV